MIYLFLPSGSHNIVVRNFYLRSTSIFLCSEVLEHMYVSSKYVYTNVHKINIFKLHLCYGVNFHNYVVTNRFRFRLDYRQFIKIRFCDAFLRPITTTTSTFFSALPYVTTTTVTSRYVILCRSPNRRCRVNIIAF